MTYKKGLIMAGKSLLKLFIERQTALETKSALCAADSRSKRCLTVCFCLVSFSIDHRNFKSEFPGGVI